MSLSGNMSKQQKRSTDLAADDIKNAPEPSANTATPSKRSTGSPIKMSTSTPTSATRPTKSSVSRSTPIAGPVKPSARPAVSTTRSRPQSTVLSSASPAIAHRPRASTSIENKRGSEKKPLPYDYRSRSTSPIKSAMKPPANARSRATSPIKPNLKSNVKQSTPRPSTTASKTPVISNAKTASVQTPTRNGKSAASPSTAEPAKKVRPALGPRKSTMSGTMEQRLRDISIVHQMLRVAMADDGDDDDEVKEQYGKEADERLADLRSRLEETRAAEAHLSPEEQSNSHILSTENHVDTSDATPPSTQPPQSLLEDLDQSGTQSSDQHELQRLRDMVASLESSLEHSQVSLQTKESELGQLSEAIAAVRADTAAVQSHGEREAQRSLDNVEELCANVELLRQAKTSAEHEVHQLEISKQRYAEQSEKNRESLEQQIRQHEDDKVRAAKEHIQRVSEISQKLDNANRETKHLNEVVKGLQSHFQEMHEAKQGEIDASAAEYENIVSKLQAEIDDAMAKSESQLDQDRASLGNVHASAAELRQAWDDGQEEQKNTVREMKTALEQSQVQVAQLSKEMAEWLEEVQCLHDAIGITDEEMKQKSENVVSLQKLLEASGAEYQWLSESSRGLEEELAWVAYKFRLFQQLTEDHRLELSKSREEHKNSLMEQHAERKRVVDGLQQTIDALRQKLHDNDIQLETLRTERDATAKRTNATTSSNASKLELLAAQLRTAQSIANHKTTRIRELESALKVTTAELVELKTERPSESGDSDASVKVTGFRLSRFPRSPRRDRSSQSTSSGESYDWTAGENFSSHVQGQVCPPLRCLV
ncbi:MAG: hypothetical protein Q9221_006964 [Calogaya cf. arnoldii]